MIITTARSVQPVHHDSFPDATVVLVGTGPLASDLAQALAEERQVEISHWKTLEEFTHAPQARRARLVIACSASCQPAFDRRVQQWCKAQRCAFLRMSIWQHEAVIGPFVLPDEPGCVECAEHRRIRALLSEASNELRFLARCENEAHLNARSPNPWLTPAARRIICLITQKDVQAILRYGMPDMGLRTVRFLRLRALTNTCHTFLPDPLCEVCARPVNDCEENAILHFQPRLRDDPRQYRLYPVAQELAALEARYVDHRLGMHLFFPLGLRTTAATFATTVASSFEYPSILQENTGTGTAHTLRASFSAAILEALERSCGFLPRSKRSAVYGSYQQLQDQAINPELFGLYTDQSASSQRFKPYEPGMPFYWVWGYSLRRQQPVLIPEQFAYYGVHATRPTSENFLAETSNGCAVGSCLEEAVLYGLCEVIERDAFLLTWYARLKVAALDWHSARDVDFLLAIERATRMTGFDFYAFDCTMDFEVPVILFLAVNRKDQAPKVLIGAGAHIDPDKALIAAFSEVAPAIVGLTERFPRDQERGRRLLQDSSLVLDTEDHLLVGVMPEALSRFSFLLEPRPLQTMQERFATHYIRQPSLDLTEELLRVTERVILRGYDVVIVDQTSPELRASNLCCVRVLVPGLLPLTFGHNFRRTRHLGRLYRLPKALGYTNNVLTEADLNPNPHPFP